MPLRRSHAKSHHGCTQCKERRIKCDEARPTCGSCRKKHLFCAFNSHRPVPWSPSTGDQGFSGGSSTALPVLELEILHHWHTATALSLAQNDALGAVFQIHVPREGLLHPFLMHSILAVAALHLSRQHSEPRRQIYSETATRQHSLALSQCAPLLNNVTRENCHALFACSLLIASFSFASLSRDLGLKRRGIVEVVEVFKLVRGSASIVQQARPWIEEGDMRLLLKFTRCAQHAPRSRHVYEVHAQLKALIEGHTGEDGDADLPLTENDTNAAILRSIGHLRDIFDSCIASDNQSTILAWPALVDPEYLDLLLQKEPRSLLALAHYGALLHIMTKAWWMEGWGLFLVHLAAEHLHPSWHARITWPLSIIRDDCGQ